MDTQPAVGFPAFGFKDLLTHIVGDIAQAVCERNGETKARQVSRSEAAVFTIMGFLPRDAIEAMLAGHCLMFHELMVDSVHDTLRGEIDTTRRATRGGIVAMDRAFANNLSRLERYQMRPAEGCRDGAAVALPPAPEAATHGPRASGPVAAPPRAAVRAAADELPGARVSAVADKPAAQVQMPAAQTPATQTLTAETPGVRWLTMMPETRGLPDCPPATDKPAASRQGSSADRSAAATLAPAEVPYVTAAPDTVAALSPASIAGAPGLFRPSPEAIAACRANPEAMAALDAGDPERFARAMGIAQPGEAYLAAAAGKGSVFDRQGAANRPPLASGGPKG